jgi:hypothetical protein
MNKHRSTRGKNIGNMAEWLVPALLALLLSGPVQSTQLGEDCIRFDPQLFEVTLDNMGYLIHHQGHRLLLFDRESEAHQTLDILRHYGVNLSCYVGRPNASMTYFLSDGQAPAGARDGEDCIAFDRERLAVIRTDAGWQLYKDDQPWMDFGSSRNQAELALAIIDQHEFDFQCFVGRPDSSFSYWRRD